MAEVVSVTNSTFETEVLKSSVPVLVDFWAPWCGPCKMLSPVIEKVAGQYQGKIKIVKVNTDDYPDVAGNYQISGVPTVILFKGGQPVDRVVGYVPEKNLSSFLDKHLG